MVFVPKHLADAIEWVLNPTKDNVPDVSLLTSEQTQLLPLPVAQAFMDLALAALQGPPRQTQSYALWSDAKTTQRARRARQRASSLTAARLRLRTWYDQTANAQRNAK